MQVVHLECMWNCKWVLAVETNFVLSMRQLFCINNVVLLACMHLAF